MIRIAVHRRYLRSFAIALALSPWAPSAARCQGHVQYIGTIERRVPDARAAPLTLNVWSSTDSTFRGYMTVAPPLGRSGTMHGWFVGDSLEFLSVSETGDSIRWYSSRVGARLAGTYTIISAAGIGQAGAWSVALAHGTALASPGTKPAASISSLRMDWLLWLLTATVTFLFAWGFWRIWSRIEPRPGEWKLPATFDDERLRGVGGWMDLFLLGQVVTVLVSLYHVPHVWTNLLGTSWSAGEIESGLRPMLVMESTVVLGRIFLPVVGIVLTTRLDRRARTWWLLYLALIFTYAAADMAEGARLLDQIRIVTGPEGIARVWSSIDAAKRSNLNALAGCSIWFLYWYRSRRVRLNFASVIDEPKRASAIAPA